MGLVDIAKFQIQHLVAFDGDGIVGEVDVRDEAVFGCAGVVEDPLGVFVAIGRVGHGVDRAAVKAGADEFEASLPLVHEIDAHFVLSLADFCLCLGDLCLEVVLLGVVGQTVEDVVALGVQLQLQLAELLTEHGDLLAGEHGLRLHVVGALHIDRFVADVVEFSDVVDDDIGEESVAFLHGVADVGLHFQNVDVLRCAYGVFVETDISIVVGVDRAADGIEDEKDERHDEGSGKDDLLLGEFLLLLFQQEEGVFLLGMLFKLKFFHSMGVVVTKLWTLGTLASRWICMRLSDRSFICV